MGYEYITRYSSPNYTPKASVPRYYGGARTIEAITIHHWGLQGQKFQNVVNYLSRKGGNTSAHEVIEAGRVAVIVNHRDAAWHTGSSRGNRTTIGLELRPEATDADYATAAERIADLRKVYGNIPLRRHSYWKATACPGKWDLNRLNRLASISLASKNAGGSGSLDIPAAGGSLPDPLTPEDDMPSLAEIASVIPNPWAYMFGRGDSRVSAGTMLAEARRDAAIARALAEESASRPVGAQISQADIERIITKAVERIDIEVTITEPDA